MFSEVANVEEDKSVDLTHLVLTTRKPTIATSITTKQIQGIIIELRYATVASMYT